GGLPWSECLWVEVWVLGPWLDNEAGRKRPDDVTRRVRRLGLRLGREPVDMVSVAMRRDNSVELPSLAVLPAATCGDVLCVLVTVVEERTASRCALLGKLCTAEVDKHETVIATRVVESEQKAISEADRIHSQADFLWSLRRHGYHSSFLTAGPAARRRCSAANRRI